MPRSGMRLWPSGSLTDFEHISTPAEKVRVNHGVRQPIFSAQRGGLILGVTGPDRMCRSCAGKYEDIDAGFDYRDPRLAANNGDTLIERSHEQHRGHAIRGVIAATIGTTIEWYDFFIYGMVASLVFDKLFFPKQSAYVGT